MEEPVNLGRRSTRNEVLLSARCRKSSWRVDRVELTDLSAGGCRIVANARDLSNGQDVEIRIAEFGNLSGTVRWVKGDCAGVAFDTSLDENEAGRLLDLYALRGRVVSGFRRSVEAD